VSWYGQLAVPAEGVDDRAKPDLVRVGDGLAHLQADGEHDLLPPLFEQLGDAQEHPSPLGGREARPWAGVERPVGGGHGRVHLCGAPVGHLGEHLAVTG
jgi:hypothetical protein